MEPIQIVGLKELNDTEKATLNKISNEYYEKFKEMLKNEIALVIQVKNYGKGGKKKYAITSRIKGPGPVFESKSSDYDFAKAIHMAMTEMENQLKHRLKTDAQKPRTKGLDKSVRY